MENVLIRYVRDAHRNPKGVVVAALVENKIRLGYSLCCGKDKFNKKFGKKIALNRLNCQRGIKNVPHTVQPYMEEMCMRAQRYFKQEDNALCLTGSEDWLG